MKMRTLTCYGRKTRAFHNDSDRTTVFDHALYKTAFRQVFGFRKNSCNFQHSTTKTSVQQHISSLIVVRNIEWMDGKIFGTPCHIPVPMKIESLNYKNAKFSLFLNEQLFMNINNNITEFGPRRSSFRNSPHIRVRMENNPSHGKNLSF